MVQNEPELHGFRKVVVAMVNGQLNTQQRAHRLCGMPSHWFMRTAKHEHEVRVKNKNAVTITPKEVPFQAVGGH